MTREHPNTDELLRMAEINGGLAHALQALLAIVKDSAGVAGFKGVGHTTSWNHFWEVDLAEKALKKSTGEKA
ncbi:hypothetical protein JC796_17650 [Delftia acidovorans]|uniref:hypothetical protein n=1 Tax=Delftia acidovorans TaxID=80866 RepID=UPI0018E777B8|nr:hypothetical protein [Delftia acidovorans]MBJ2142571.1 hypothetical protein [Delftia acidovorans]